MGQKNLLSRYVVQKDHPDYEAFRKSIFRLKLDGTHEPIFRMAYMMGYMQGHEFGKLMGTIEASDLDCAFVEFKKWLDNQCKDQKPT
jgi:hypothetical protein